jgi:hypothetical protein
VVRVILLQMANPEAAAAPSDSDLVMIRDYVNLPDALLAKTILDSADIECFLYDENVIRMDWLLSNALGGIKLRVKREDASAALELLDQEPIAKIDLGGKGEYEQPRCPQCGSLDISFGETGKHLSYVTIALGVPLPVHRSGWKCHSCGHAWNEREDSPAQPS